MRKYILPFVIIISFFFISSNNNLKSNTLVEQAMAILSSKSPGTTIKFAVLSDIHYGVNDDNDDFVERLLDSIALLSPDFIIICGDAVEGDEYLNSLYDFLKNDPIAEEGWMFNNEIPVFLVPGNHEFKTSGLANYKTNYNPFWNGSIGFNNTVVNRYKVL